VSDPSNIDSETESTPPRDVLIVPSEFFFIESVEVPSALEPSELDDFAELSIEGFAPFPLEQLCWGYLASSSNDQILLYAALRDRLKREGFTDLEEYTWVLPDFATLHGARFPQARKIFLIGETSSTLLDQPSGEGLPQSIAPADDAPTGAFKLRAITPTLDEHGLPSFEFEALSEAPGDGHWSPLKPDEKTLWQADIRQRDFKVAERNTRRTTALVTKIMGFAALFAVLLIVLEGLLYAGGFWLSTREAKIEAQLSDVRRIEDKQSLMNKLEQVAQNELRPIGILEAANEIRLGLGKTGIEYDEVAVEGTNRITIEGKANTINELNKYTDSLGNSGAFALVGDPKYITRGGKTTFTVTLDYTHKEPTPEEAVTAEPEDNTGTRG
jgi:Tfp pilus assembly protein PilN